MNLFFTAWNHERGSWGEFELDRISGSGDMGQNEKISRNMIITEKMIMTNIMGNFVAEILFLGWKR